MSMPLDGGVGRVLGGRYRLLAPIGAGASARVYLADDITLRRQVAVKVLRPGVKLDGAAPAVADPPPVLGADAAEIYGAIGLDDSVIAQLREEGVI